MNRKISNHRQFKIYQKSNKHRGIKNKNRQEGRVESLEEQFQEYISDQESIFNTIVMRQFRRK